MRSIFRDITPAEIFVELRMHRVKHKGVFFLVEGAHDIRRFSKFFDERSVFSLPCHGKENVIGTIDLVQNSGDEDCLGFADSDFDRIDQCIEDNEDVIHSKHHDFDLDVCKSGATARYLVEVALEDKIAGIGGCDALLNTLLEVIEPLSALRYANVKHRLGYSLTSVRLDEFFDGFVLDINKMIDSVSTGRFGSAECKAAIRAKIDQYSGTDFDLWQFSNGHDLMAALGIALRSRVANRAVPQTWRREVEAHLRLTFDWDDFHATGLAGKIEEWRVARNGPNLIRQFS